MPNETSKLVSIPEDIARDLINIAYVIISDRDLNSSSIMFIVYKLMKGIEKYPTLSGQEKKETVIICIRLVVEKSDIDSSMKTILFDMVKTVIPETIDIIIDGANSKEFKKKAKKCFYKCCYVSKK